MQKLILQWANSEGQHVTGPRDRHCWHITRDGVTSLSFECYKEVLSDLTEGMYSPIQLRHIARGINYYAYRNNLASDAFKTQTILTDVDIKRLREVFEYHSDMGHVLIVKSVKRYII